MNSIDADVLARDLLLDALRGLYLEQPGLVGFGDGGTLSTRALRANERAVAARLAVHVDRVLRTRQSTLTVDVEYSRVLMGVAQKMGPSGQIFPDLIVHHRGETDRNLLAVELKPGVPRNPTLVDKGDAQKMRHLTNPGWMLGQSAYAHGVCLQLAHDCGRLHWYERGQLIEREDWTPPGL